MRNHNEVDYLFLFVIYALLGGIIIYIAYKSYKIIFKKKKTTEEEEGKEKEKDKQKFVEVFIHETSKKYNKNFH